LSWRSIVKDWLLRRGIVLSRPPGQFNVAHVKLRQLKLRGFEIHCAVDGGAADGGWTRELKEVYPGAQVLCIEPREQCQAALRKMSSELSGIHLAQTLIGDHEGEAAFFELGDSSSILKSEAAAVGKNLAQIPMTTLDTLIGQAGLPPPNLIKLDLQGAELTALNGARSTLAGAQAVLLELSFHRFYEGSAVFTEAIGFMRDAGFQCYDVFALWHRPLDGALAQGDFLFLKECHPLWSDRRWSLDSTQQWEGVSAVAAHAIRAVETAKANMIGS